MEEVALSMGGVSDGEESDKDCARKRDKGPDCKSCTQVGPQEFRRSLEPGQHRSRGGEDMEEFCKGEVSPLGQAQQPGKGRGDICLRHCDQLLHPNSVQNCSQKGKNLFLT